MEAWSTRSVQRGSRMATVRSRMRTRPGQGSFASRIVTSHGCLDPRRAPAQRDWEGGEGAERSSRKATPHILLDTKSSLMEGHPLRPPDSPLCDPLPTTPPPHSTTIQTLRLSHPYYLLFSQLVLDASPFPDSSHQTGHHVVPISPPTNFDYFLFLRDCPPFPRDPARPASRTPPEPTRTRHRHRPHGRRRNTRRPAPPPIRTHL